MFRFVSAVLSLLLGAAAVSLAQNPSPSPSPREPEITTTGRGEVARPDRAGVGDLARQIRDAAQEVARLIQDVVAQRAQAAGFQLNGQLATLRVSEKPGAATERFYRTEHVAR